MGIKLSEDEKEEIRQNFTLKMNSTYLDLENIYELLEN